MESDKSKTVSIDEGVELIQEMIKGGLLENDFEKIHQQMKEIIMMDDTMLSSLKNRIKEFSLKQPDGYQPAAVVEFAKPESPPDGYMTFAAPPEESGRISNLTQEALIEDLKNTDALIQRAMLTWEGQQSLAEGAGRSLSRMGDKVTSAMLDRVIDSTMSGLFPGFSDFQPERKEYLKGIFGQRLKDDILKWDALNNQNQIAKHIGLLDKSEKNVSTANAGTKRPPNLEVMKDLAEKSHISWRTLHEALGLDPNEEKARLEAQLQYPEQATGLFEKRKPGKLVSDEDDFAKRFLTALLEVILLNGNCCEEIGISPEFAKVLFEYPEYLITPTEEERKRKSVIFENQNLIGSLPCLNVHGKKIWLYSEVLPKTPDNTMVIRGCKMVLRPELNYAAYTKFINQLPLIGEWHDQAGIRAREMVSQMSQNRVSKESPQSNLINVTNMDEGMRNQILANTTGRRFGEAYPSTVIADRERLSKMSNEACNAEIARMEYISEKLFYILNLRAPFVDRIDSIQGLILAGLLDSLDFPGAMPILNSEQRNLLLGWARKHGPDSDLYQLIYRNDLNYPKLREQFGEELVNRGKMLLGAPAGRNNQNEFVEILQQEFEKMTGDERNLEIAKMEQPVCAMQSTLEDMSKKLEQQIEVLNQALIMGKFSPADLKRLMDFGLDRNVVRGWFTKYGDPLEEYYGELDQLLNKSYRSLDPGPVGTSVAKGVVFSQDSNSGLTQTAPSELMQAASRVVSSQIERALGRTAGHLWGKLTNPSSSQDSSDCAQGSDQARGQSGIVYETPESPLPESQTSATESTTYYTTTG